MEMSIIQTGPLVGAIAWSDGIMTLKKPFEGTKFTTRKLILKSV